MLLRNGQTIKGFGGKALALSRDEKQGEKQVPIQEHSKKKKNITIK